MAKIRRIIRKVKPATPQSFDDQFWPVMVALVVLGGFILGSILAYLRFDDPRWYANALVWVIVTVLAVAGTAVALATVKNRAFRRSMQLAVVLGLLFHSILLVGSIELKIFDRIFDVFLANNEMVPQRQPVSVPEYVQMSREDRVQPDYERPVETETPEPEAEPIQRREVEPETRLPEPQPTPVPEPEQTPRPNVVKKQQSEETAPRYSEQQSQLSRQVTQARPTRTSTAAAASPATAPRETTASLQARASDIQRQPTRRDVRRHLSDQAPATDAPAPSTSLARRESDQAPEPQTTATPAMQRRLDRPVAVPRADVTLADSPVMSERTSPNEIRPRTTLAAKQTTAAPDSNRQQAEPVPDVRTAVDTQPQRRQLATEARPNVAQTPVSVPNERTRATTRPDLASAAREVNPSPIAAPAREMPAPADAASSIARRTVTEANAAGPAVAAEMPSRNPLPASAIARRQAEATPQPSASAVAEGGPSPPTPRATAAPQPRTSSTVAAATPAVSTPSPAMPSPQPQVSSLARSDTSNRPSPALSRNTAGPAEATASASSSRMAASSTVRRATPITEQIAAAASAPTSVPRRQTAQPRPSPAAVVQGTEPSGETPTAAATSRDVAAAPTGTQRQSPTAGSGAERSAAQPAEMAAAPAGSESGAPSATRRPRGESAPNVAAAPASAPSRRQSASSIPSVTTMAADVSARSAPTRSTSDQPRPSSAAIARASRLNPTGSRSQSSMEVETASTATQFAPPASQRRPSSNQPSINPSAPPTGPTARTATPSSVAASPTNVESPVVAESVRGVSNPAAEPARTAMTKAITGTAGVGQGRNLDRARPAADSPALVASASARRAQSTQSTPPGPALSPQAPALVRRSVAGAQTPGATVQAQPLADVATTAGAAEPDRVAANASAALTRADANASRGPVTAAAGNAEIDLGPQRVVSEGQMGRASGGGQPTINFETEAPRIARSTTLGGAPLAAVASAVEAPVPTAPMATGGGQPNNPQTDAQTTAVARTDAGDAGPVSGGPTKAVETGPATEISMSQEVAETTLARAELAEAVPGDATSGGGDEDEDEEERKRRLARIAGRLSGPNSSTLADVAPASQQASDQSGAGPAAAMATVERTGSATTAASGADLAVAASDAVGMTAPDATSRLAGRAEVSEDAPGGLETATARSSSIARADVPGPRIATRTSAVTIGASASAPGSGDVAASQAVATGTEVERSETDAPSPTGGSSVAGEPAATVVAASGAAMARASTADAAQPDMDRSAGNAYQTARRAGPTVELAMVGPASIAAAESPETGQPAVNPLATTTARTAGGGTPTAGQASDATPVEATSGASGGDLLAAAQYTRSEAVEGAAGTPEIGGGTATPTRSAVGPTPATTIRAERVSMAGATESGGLPEGSRLAAQGNQTGRLPMGRRADPSSGPVGTRGSNTVVDVASIEQPGLAAGNRSTSPSLDDGPTVGQTVNVGAPLSRVGHTTLPPGSMEVAVVDVPSTGSSEAVAQATMDHAADGASGLLDVSRQTTEGGLAVNIDAAQGPGGLGAEATVDVGLNNRRAFSESMQVQVRTARFVRHDVGGLPDMSTAAIAAAEPFRQRMGRTSGDGTGQGDNTPPPMTEETIELGLGFLSRQQLPDGSWSLQGINGESALLVTDTGATALSLLAFQGAGYNHREHKYADVVRGGIDYLLKNQKEDGDLFLPLDDESNKSVRLYSHALATLALCEAYGMTQDPSLRKPAQRAMDFCVASQHPERGGWRYTPQVGSDTSVTGWMMMALKSGDLAGLKTPPKTYQLIRKWLDLAQESPSRRDLYRYNPYAPDTSTQRHGRVPSKTMTSVGLLMRLYLGWDQENPNLIRGAEYLAENLPRFGRPNDPQRDTYYWYYATQVMFHMGGDYWKAWNGRLHPLLVESQVKQGSMSGSWDPRNPIPDRWGPHAGRLYVTTMNLLSLEVYYRHLPLYQDTL